MAEKRKNNLTPETRQKLSELAKQRHAEGKLGGRKYGLMGGRPKKERAASRVAEAAQEERNARRIVEVFKDAIHESQPMGVRLKGAELWLTVERDDAKVALQEEATEHKHRSREELLQILSEKLTAGPAAEILQRELTKGASQQFVDAEVVEDADGAS